MRAYAAGAEQGVWDALLETLVELGLTDDWQHMIDSTTIRDHSQAAGAERGLILTLIDQNPFVHSLRPIDMIRQGWRSSLRHASQQWPTMSS